MKIQQLRTPKLDEAQQNLSGWLKPSTGEFFKLTRGDDEGYHHLDLVLDNIKAFGLTFKQMKNIEDTSALIANLGKKGWVRTNYFDDVLYMDVTPKTAIPSVKWGSNFTNNIVLGIWNADGKHFRIEEITFNGMADINDFISKQSVTQDTKVNEAPIGDYELIGKWGDKEKSHSFSHAVDRKMIQHPTAVHKARKKFGLTEHILNFYFVNLPGARKFAEIGLVEPEEIMQMMPKAAEEILGREGQDEGINVIFVGNAGLNRVPMTAWIMAHRVGHAIQTTYRKNSSTNEVIYSWKEYEEDLINFMRNILDDVYNWELPAGMQFWGYGDHDKTLTKFFESIGTMRSARQGNLGGRPYEFVYELFAQYITTGRIAFRPLPKQFGIRGGRRHRIQDQEVAEMHNRDLNSHIADHLGARIDNCLYSVTGKYLIM